MRDTKYLTLKENIRLLTPMMPTMPKPLTVTRLVSLMEEIPLMMRRLWLSVRWMSVPREEGLRVLRMTMGMFLWNTGKMVDFD